MQKRLKILISAYACSPNHGSEPGMGWNFVYALSKCHEIHVITEKEKWETEIMSKLDSEPKLKDNLSFYFIKKKRNKILRRIWPPSYYFFYRKWQKEAYELARGLERVEDFDIIHQLNMVGYREPGFLWRINKPFVWGPIGGMEVTPWKFLPSLGLYGFVFYFARNCINLMQLHLLSRPKMAARRGDIKLIAATPDTKMKIKKYFKVSSVVMPEVGSISNEIRPSIKFCREGEPLRLVWSGLHTPRKGLNYLISAISKLPNLNLELNVIGDGVYNRKWRKLAELKGVSHLIKWHGWVSRETALSIMRDSDLFCITSMHDLSSTVTLEALSFGLPVICPDHCGFSYIVNNTCGVKILVTSPNQFVNDYAHAITKLQSDRNLLDSLSLGAIKRAADFSWEHKIEQLNGIYNSLST